MNPQPQPTSQPASAPEQTMPAEPAPRLLDSVIDTTAEMQKLKMEEEKFTFQQRRAKLFAASGLFSAKDLNPDMAVAQAMVRIELGESMGISPAESLQGIYVINGQTAISSAVRAARMQASGYSWQIEWIGTEDDCKGCRLWLYYRGKPLIGRDGKEVSVAFTEKDAQKMKTQIWENGNKRSASILEKDNWKMSPRNMYFARAITNAQRFHAPAALSTNILSYEEALDFPVEEVETQQDGQVDAWPIVNEPPAAPPKRPTARERVLSQAGLLPTEPEKKGPESAPKE
jgi:hypothetical protein